MILYGFISILGPFFIYINFLESPRFLLTCGKFRDGFEIMNKMGTINKGALFEPLNLEEKEILVA